MTDTLVSLSSAAAPVRCRYLAGNAHARPTATVSAAFHRQNADRSAQHHLSVRSPGDRQHRRSARSPAIPTRDQKTNQTRALNPHSPTAPTDATPPAVSSLEAFRTPASVHALAPVTGRRPKTLNDSGRSSGCALRARPPAGDLCLRLLFPANLRSGTGETLVIDPAKQRRQDNANRHHRPGEDRHDRGGHAK